jgi:hypothetical protein
MLASTLIQTGYRLAGIQIEAGRSYSTSQGNEGLAVLNSMLDSFQIDRLLVPTILGQTFPIATGQQSYTVGIGGDISIPRPTQLVRGGYVFTSTNPQVEVPMEIWNDQQWDAEETKTLTATIPYALYYQRDIGDNTGFGYLYPWPIPTSSGNIVLYVWGNYILQQLPALETSFVLLPGYQEMLENNLAVRIAQRFPTRAHLSNLTLSIAASSMRRVKTMNDGGLLMQCEQAAGGVNRGQGTFNMLSGHYNASSNWT